MQCFPIASYYHRKAHKRCSEEFNLEERNECFGPKDRHCVDCFYPLLPIFTIFYLTTWCLMQFTQNLR